MKQFPKHGNKSCQVICNVWAALRIDSGASSPCVLTLRWTAFHASGGMPKKEFMESMASLPVLVYVSIERDFLPSNSHF